MDHYTSSFCSRSGIVGGTLISIIINITSADLFKTAVLAGVGAAVSFLVSFVLKLLIAKKNKPRD